MCLVTGIPKSPSITTQSPDFADSLEAIGAEMGLNGKDMESGAEEMERTYPVLKAAHSFQHQHT
jgi:hypothetical protein